MHRDKSTYNSLIRQLYINPDDDLPRLALADYLEDHGDTIRAEFIRHQIRQHGKDNFLKDERVVNEGFYNTNYHHIAKRLYGVPLCLHSPSRSRIYTLTIDGRLAICLDSYDDIITVVYIRGFIGSVIWRGQAIDNEIKHFINNNINLEDQIFGTVLRSLYYYQPPIMAEQAVHDLLTDNLMPKIANRAIVNHLLRAPS